MREIRITGTFTTGTTQDDPDLAKESVVKLLEAKLKESQIVDGLFSFVIRSVVSEYIGGTDPYKETIKLLYSPEFSEELLVEAVTLWLQNKKKIKILE